MKKKYKIGVFDSGVGGLSILEKLKKLPVDHFIYLADTANLPYGEKSPEQIIEFTRHAINYLIEQKVDAIVIACHTASAIALEHLSLSIPIVGVVEPAIQAALEKTKHGNLGVIGTPATITSSIHAIKIKGELPEAIVFGQSCPQFVPLIEAGLQNKQALRDACIDYLTPLQKECDTVIIGCTHYEFIRQEITSYFDETVSVISAPVPTVEALSNMLYLDEQRIQHQEIEYSVTGDLQKFKETAALLNVPLTTVNRVTLTSIDTKSNGNPRKVLLQ